MRNRVLLLVIIAIVIVVLGAGAALVLPGLTGGTGTTTPGTGPNQVAQAEPTDTPVPAATPIPMVEIVVAIQDLPRGFVIPPNAVRLQLWPADSTPFQAITNLEQVIGKIARTDIYREQPILLNMLVEDLTGLAGTGSDAAAVLPSDRVAIALPMDRITSVAYAIQPGDRVDVIVSLLFVDVDEVFQSVEPNVIRLLTTNEQGALTVGESLPGRIDILPRVGEVIIGPSEAQRPRLVTQRTVQNALVVWVGDHPYDGRLFDAPPTPTPVPTPIPAGQQAAPEQAAAAAQPTVPPPRPDIITLGVSPQDAVVLVWFVEARLPLTFALRSATTTSQVPTDPVTLDYIMNRFRIDLPGRRPFSIQPAITSIRQLLAEGQVFTSGGQ